MEAEYGETIGGMMNWVNSWYGKPTETESVELQPLIDPTENRIGTITQQPLISNPEAEQDAQELQESGNLWNPEDNEGIELQPVGQSANVDEGLQQATHCRGNTTK